MKILHIPTGNLCIVNTAYDENIFYIAICSEKAEYNNTINYSSSITKEAWEKVKTKKIILYIWDENKWIREDGYTIDEFELIS